ncbi:hypothetical protein Kisp01_70220 [Kineosporia sp. NBRC 101677]|nr:hypothetical protein Kisp01_70220 [Kineosporia sp. NBRC 101677]
MTTETSSPPAAPDPSRGIALTSDDLVAVSRWDGQLSAALRTALRMSVIGFAEHLGISTRAVANWEARGASLTQTPTCQAILDTVLERATTPQRARFLALRQAAIPSIVIHRSHTQRNQDQQACVVRDQSRPEAGPAVRLSA